MADLVNALTRVRNAIAAVDLPLDIDGSAEAMQVHAELVDQIDDYLLPRLARLDAPVLIVLGGSTGSGKSTITNSLVESSVSLAGVLRPSTRSPVLVCHPDDHEWFASGGVLPQLARSTGRQPSGSGLHLVTNDRLPDGLALLDAPDIDSVEIANHELAAQLLGAADAWLFVTTAARYADAVPWDYLTRGRDRAIAMAIVVNRIPPGATSDIVDHLGDMLRAHGLRDVPLFAIDEAALDDRVAHTDLAPAAESGIEHGSGGGPDADAPPAMDDGRLPASALVRLRAWLDGLVADDASRDDLVRSTIDGALDSIPTRVATIGAALARQESTIDTLRAISRRQYDDALTAIDAELASGVLLRGEVLDRWREHVGTGAFMERLQQGVGAIRTRLRSLLTRSPVDAQAAQQQLESNLETLVRNHADHAALATVSTWEATPGGRLILAAAQRGIDRPTPGLPDRLARQIEQWQDNVLQLVSDQAGNKLAVARVLTLGVNGAGVALMIAVFSQTGGVSGAEAGVAAGTAAASQAVLTAIFGDNAVRDLVATARTDLELRLAGEFEIERARFDALLAHVPDVDDRAELESAVHVLQTVRR